MVFVPLAVTPVTPFACDAHVKATPAVGLVMFTKTEVPLEQIN